MQLLCPRTIWRSISPVYSNCIKSSRSRVGHKYSTWTNLVYLLELRSVLAQKHQCKAKGAVTLQNASGRAMPHMSRSCPSSQLMEQFGHLLQFSQENVQSTGCAPTGLVRRQPLICRRMPSSRTVNLRLWTPLFLEFYKHFVLETAALRRRYKNLVLTMNGYGAHTTYKALKLLRSMA